MTSACNSGRADVCAKFKGAPKISNTQAAACPCRKQRSTKLKAPELCQSLVLDTVSRLVVLSNQILTQPPANPLHESMRLRSKPHLEKPHENKGLGSSPALVVALPSAAAAAEASQMQNF